MRSYENCHMTHMFQYLQYGTGDRRLITHQPLTLLFLWYTKIRYSDSHDNFEHIQSHCTASTCEGLFKRKQHVKYNIVQRCMQSFEHPVARCWMMLHDVAWSLNQVKLHATSYNRVFKRCNMLDDVACNMLRSFERALSEWKDRSYDHPRVTLSLVLIWFGAHWGETSGNTLQTTTGGNSDWGPIILDFSIQCKSCKSNPSIDFECVQNTHNTL